MSRNTILALVLGTLVAGGAPCALAAPGAALPDPAGASVQAGGFGGHRMPGMRMRGEAAPARAAIGDLRRIERLYLIEGRARELPALYKDVLAKTRNPTVRNYVYDRLARAQLKPANADQAIATLRQSLDENLARLDGAPQRGRD
ncbi:MAG: hypothetical protein ABFC67_08385 [Mizugakiibacter sp.]|uniref:hypothetical protein n=1 Tax=Mizugakiibacter sp. TaxID=1972610 RepID=UPI0031BC7C7F|nr:hypothetical protein [Xanthomonadaceae bacterium]